MEEYKSKLEKYRKTYENNKNIQDNIQWENI